MNGPCVVSWAMRWGLTAAATLVLCLTGVSVLTGRGLMVSGVRGLRAFALCEGRIASLDLEQVGVDVDPHYGGRLPRQRRFGSLGDYLEQRADRVGFWTLDAVECNFFMQCARAEGKPITPVWPFAVVLGVPAGVMWRARLARRVRRGVCRSCGYDLTGNVNGICPECGARASETAPPVPA